MQLAFGFILSVVDFSDVIGLKNQIALHFKKLFVTLWHQKVRIKFKLDYKNRTSG